MHDDTTLLARLRAGDEQAFNALVREHDGALRRVARTFVRTDSAVEDVMQETWLGVIRGLDGFQGRSTLRTWIFGILVNQARRRGVRDAGCVPARQAGASSRKRANMRAAAVLMALPRRGGRLRVRQDRRDSARGTPVPRDRRLA